MTASLWLVAMGWLVALTAAIIGGRLWWLWRRDVAALNHRLDEIGDKMVVLTHRHDEALEAVGQALKAARWAEIIDP